MLNNRVFVFVLILMFYGISVRAQISWPGGKKAAVVLTYDDGISSDWDIVMPQLEKKGFKGTFFLYGLVVKPQEIPIWRMASKKGHELGNHSIFHICGNDLVVNCKTSFDCLYCYNIEMMLKEISIMNTFLSAIDGNNSHAYAYPCGEYKVGGIDYTDSLAQTGLVKYARDGGGGILTNLDSFRPMHVPCVVGSTGMKGNQLIDSVKQAIVKHGLAVFVFHGVGGNYLKVDAKEHEKLLDFLKIHHNELWVETFTKVLDYVSSLKKKTSIDVN
jgi:peptidoglycan-N-acetylglucosamine deacetylase